MEVIGEDWGVEMVVWIKNGMDEEEVVKRGLEGKVKIHGLSY